VRLLLSALFVGLASVAQAAPDGSALHTQHGCASCHTPEAKAVGPAYKDIAAKYRGKKSAPTQLIAKIKKGGAGAWGDMPMPPQSVSDAELKTLVQWVLTRK